LRDLGMRGDIIKTMHRVFTERGQDRGIADYVIDTAEGVIHQRRPWGQGWLTRSANLI
jgi:type IV secretory pathway VirD2 relaxase